MQQRLSMESQNCLMILIFIILGGYVIILGGYIIILGGYVIILGGYVIILGAYVFIFGAFRNMMVPLPKSQTRHPARAQAPLPLPHKFFDVKSFNKIPPHLPIVIAKSR